MSTLALHAVCKQFGRTRALDDVSFSVAAGEVVGLVGTNGSGKTTTMRILCGYLEPDAGRVEVAGRDPGQDRAAARAAVGYLPESVPLYGDMRVAEYLRFRARLKGLPRGRAAARAGEVCETCGLGGQERRIIGHLSRGMRQRVGLADALLAEPQILLLDEPTSGLDPVQVREVRALVARLAARHTLVIASHALTEIEAMASRVIVLAGGRVAGDGTPAALGAACGLDAGSSLEEVFVALCGRAPAAHGPDRAGQPRGHEPAESA